MRHASGRAAVCAIGKPADAVVQRGRKSLKIVLNELIPRDIQCIRVCSGQIFIFFGVRNLHAGDFNIVFVQIRRITDGRANFGGRGMIPFHPQFSVPVDVCACAGDLTDPLDDPAVCQILFVRRAVNDIIIIQQRIDLCIQRDIADLAAVFQQCSYRKRK